MKSRNMFAFLLVLLSNGATLTFAQYVTTVTVSINTDPFCTGIGAFGSSAGGTIVSGSVSGSGLTGNGTIGGGAATSVSGSGSGGPNGSVSGTGSATSLSPTVTPTAASNGQYESLGYYPIPADGNLLDGPIITNPLMTLELCGTDCQGYRYLALENGDECNCGFSPPNGTSSSSPPSKNKRQTTSGDCIPCGGNSAECCGAPGGYALVYRVTPNVESSSVVAYSTTNPAGSVTEASSTSYTYISSGSLGYTSTGSNESLTSGSTTSSVAVESTSTDVYTTTSDSSIVVVGATTSYAQTSSSTYNYSTTASASSVIVATPTFVSSAAATTGFGSGINFTGSSLNSTGSGTNSTGPGTSFTGPSSNSTGSRTNSTAAGSNHTVVSGTGTGTGSSSTGFGSYSNYTFSNTVLTSSTATATDHGIAPAAHGDGSGATTTTNGGPEPTQQTPTPSCAQSANYVGNNTRFSDYFGYTYDIRCNLNLQSTPTDHDAFAVRFEDCLEYCSLLTDCVAVTYQDPPSPTSNSSNCFPKWDFEGYTETSVDGVYSGVNVNGASSGQLNAQNLCTSDNNQGASYAGPPASVYTDDYGQAWTIGCNTTLSITANTALYPTVTDNLATCVDYCSVYDSCDLVNWTGSHTNGTANDPNCFPASSNGNAGAAGSAPGSGYATLVPPSD